MVVNQSIAYAQLDNEDGPTDIFIAMRVTITQNIDKQKGVVNGQIAYVHNTQNTTIFLRLPNDLIVAIYPVTLKRGENDVTMYPIRLAYANTMCKAQGQTLEKDTTPPGAAYVAMSRVKTLSDLYFLTPLKTSHFTPVNLA
jgi:ATP-dependent exoDNAse (exonuclease V) alpha subunit